MFRLYSTSKFCKFVAHDALASYPELMLFYNIWRAWRIEKLSSMFSSTYLTWYSLHFTAENVVAFVKILKLSKFTISLNTRTILQLELLLREGAEIIDFFHPIRMLFSEHIYDYSKKIIILHNIQWINAHHLSCFLLQYQ